MSVRVVPAPPPIAPPHPAHSATFPPVAMIATKTAAKSHQESGFREFRVSPGVEVVAALLAGVPAAACELPRLSGVPAALEELVAARLAGVGVAPSN